MALPLSRDETATAATPVHSNLINKLQDCVIGGKHGTITQSLPLVPALNDTSGTTGKTNAQTISGASGVVTIGLNLPIGAHISAIRARVQDNLTGPTKVAIKLCSSVDSGATVTIGTSAQSAGSGAFQTITLTVSQITAGLTSYWIAIPIMTGTQSCIITNVEIDWDMP